MSFSKISIKRFRCFDELSLDLSPGVNFFYGANGSGKTSILESIFIFSSGKSFKSSNISSLINFKFDNFNLKAFDSERGYIAEIKKDTNLIVEEDRKDILTEISGETFFRHIKIQSNIDKQGIISYISAESGLLWVLYGERYSFPKTTNIIPSVGKSFSAQSTLAVSYTHLTLPTKA